MFVKALLTTNQIIASHLRSTKPHLIPYIEAIVHNSTCFLSTMNITSEILMELIPEVSPYQIIDLIPDGNDMPNIYGDNTLYFVEGKYYANFNGTRHYITSGNVFFHRGWEFSSAIRLNHPNDLDFLPEGSPLLD
jgi:hypothetical protein